MKNSLRSFLNTQRLRLRNRLGWQQDPACGGDPDNSFYVGGNASALRDRPLSNLQDVIEASLDFWRNDPLTRRLVTLTTQFVIGRGIQIQADGLAEDQLLHEFWQHPLNHMDARVQEWSDELYRTGNLFVMLSSDPCGTTYVRAVPAGQIEEIIPRENDIEQPLSFKIREMAPPEQAAFSEEKNIPAANLLIPTLEDRMLHFTVNRPVGAQWGEPDLAPLLKWLRLYHNWLEQRALLNKYRNCFVFVVKTNSTSEQSRLKRQRELNMSQPVTGSVLVTGPNEEWEILSPELQSTEANEDGLAMKKMIAAGAGIPLQFLAEPGSSSKADSEALDGSTCRNFEQRQQLIAWIVETVLRHVLSRAALVDSSLNADCPIHVSGDEIRTVIPSAEEPKPNPI